MTQSFSVATWCFVVVPVGFANFGLTRRHSHTKRCEVNLFSDVILIFLCAYVRVTATRIFCFLVEPSCRVFRCIWGGGAGLWRVRLCTSQQRDGERGVFFAKEFNNSVTSSPQPLRKVERAYVRCVIVCVCVCVIDCVRVFGEDCPRFLRDDAFLRGLVIRENEDIPPPPSFLFSWCSVCKRGRCETMSLLSLRSRLLQLSVFSG